MATQVPPFNPMIPVTPPPEHQAFVKPGFQSSTFEVNPAQNMAQPPPYSKTPPSLDTPTFARPQVPSPDNSNSSQDEKDRVNEKTNPVSPTAATGTQNQPQTNLDPRYVAMVSRISSYYQQRCQAITNAQQQRCQAWANMHRQKCQDAMQAAMLVVAWYIRDRIQKKRRKTKRNFRVGLRAKAQATRASRQTGGDGRDSVRRWLMQVPEDPVSAHLPAMEAASEAASAEEEPAQDKDVKLYEMADRLIKSQFKKVDVPMLGLLSFEESDDESDFDEDGEREDRYAAAAAAAYRWTQPGPVGDAGAARHRGAPRGVPFDFEEDEDDEDDEMEESGPPVSGSQAVQQDTATGTGSRIMNRSSSS